MGPPEMPRGNRQFFTVGACRRKRVAFSNSLSVSCRIWFCLIKIGFHMPGRPIKREQGIPPLLERGKPAPPAARTRSSQQCARSSNTRWGQPAAPGGDKATAAATAADAADEYDGGLQWTPETKSAVMSAVAGIENKTWQRQQQQQQQLVTLCRMRARTCHGRSEKNARGILGGHKI